MSVYVIASDVHRLHHCLEFADGVLSRSVEGPDRADIIADALRDAGHDLIAPAPITDELLARVHTPEYVEFLATAWDRWQLRVEPGPAAMGFTWPSRGVVPKRPNDLIGQLGYHSFAADCSIVAGTWTAVRESASIALTATERVVAGASAAYGLCRPPGHHATRDQFGGYCFLNNAAIAAQRLLDSGIARVAVLDVDYHHGNGTQDIFLSRSDVFTVSLHADPIDEFPWFSGHASERGAGRGEEWNLNIPLPSGTTFETWAAALDVALDRVRSSGAEVVVVSLGVDTFKNDPLGTFQLDTDDYTRIAERIADLSLPMVVVQEGGYAVAEIGANVAAFLQPL